ncbi:hypothetical protein ONZ45_g17345 [Pleurotus djamor]|nr:hypothetical protein ONZ45_g17345 [Pleurotus djamor]
MEREKDSIDPPYAFNDEFHYIMFISRSGSARAWSEDRGWLHVLIPICLHNLPMPRTSQAGKFGPVVFTFQCLTNGLEYTYSSRFGIQASLNDFGSTQTRPKYFGFSRSRGLTNGLEYTYSSPSAYTTDRGILEFLIKTEAFICTIHISVSQHYPASHDRVDDALTCHFDVFNIFAVLLVSRYFAFPAQKHNVSRSRSLDIVGKAYQPELTSTLYENLKFPNKH